ncbi:tumor necrosis factor ligand superfamily member 10-like [Synchiropus picturatus]
MAASSSPQCLWVVVLVAILLQTLAIAVSFLYFNTVLSTMREDFSHSSVSCLINAHLRPRYENAVAEEKQRDPCWQVTQQLHYHIEKTMAERFQREMRHKLTGAPPPLSPGVPLPKVAAHVTALSAAEPPAPEVAGGRGAKGYLGERVRGWDGRRGMSFLHNMELRGGELLVSTAGLYYIYAQTYFRLTSTQDPDEDEEGGAVESREQEGAQLVQYIYKKMSSYPDPILLMKSSRPACWPKGPEPGLFSLYQAGTAFLHPADRLFVTVSNASTMEMDGRASYYGAFLVG